MILTSLLCFIPVLFYILFIYISLPKGTLSLTDSLKYFIVGTSSVAFLLIIFKLFPNIQQKIVLEQSILGIGFDTLFILSFIQVALVEESTKLIAFNIGNNIIKENNPLATMFYCGISTLGFAYIENIKYAIDYDNHLIIVRSFTSMFLHLLCGLLMGYWMGLMKLPIKKNNLTHFEELVNKFKTMRKIYHFLIALVLSTMLHGLFDFSLFTKSDMTDTFLILMIGTLSVYFSYLNLSGIFNRIRRNILK